MRLRRFLYLGGASLIVLIVFTLDVIRKSVELEIGGLMVIRDVLVIGGFALVYLFFELSSADRDQSPVKKLGLALIASLIMIVIAVGAGLSHDQGFDTKDLSLLPLDYPTLFLACIISLSFGIFAVLIIRVLRDLVLYKRKRGSQRNFLIFIALMTAGSASTLMLKPLDSSIFTGIFFGLTILFGIVNSFRLSWIVYLTKREKIFSLIYGFFLFGGFLGLNILVQNSSISKSLLYYSYPLKHFIQSVTIFGNVYFGMAFVSTLFHLPTAEAFERKTSEVTSLHNLSKLVTQVFDFKQLVDTVTSMTLQVCEAKSCWLEIIYTGDDIQQDGVQGRHPVVLNPGAGRYYVQVAGMKNITQPEIDMLFPAAERTLRDAVLEERQPIVVDDIVHDSRFKRFRKDKAMSGSLVVVPLLSHSGVMGILYATKETAFGFFKDDVDVISAFADQATVAIENSRLISKSIERERLLREMMLAQEMQKRLLPQSLPKFPTLEIDAISTPAFEVGGDYYDFVQLDQGKLGIVVGDVSGKGVSAALYMSEVKGIFQALGKMYPSPKQFLVKANEALTGSIDKRSFVSLIYAVIDVRAGQLTISRAGHCPMLLVSKEKVGYIRPQGMGMGLSDGPIFSDAMEEERVQLHDGDVCVFYTDGVTEARCGEDEFGYDRLLRTAERCRGKPATAIKEEILETVKTFIEHKANHDDLTIVVVKWCGNSIPVE